MKSIKIGPSQGNEQRRTFQETVLIKGFANI